MNSTRNTFDLVAGGRTYTCRIEELHRGRPERGWWFDVGGDHSRYAPFRAVAGDTELSVRSRMVAYCEDRLVRRGWIDARPFGDSPARG
jgi:hypothetical protein